MLFSLEICLPRPTPLSPTRAHQSPQPSPTRAHQSPQPSPTRAYQSPQPSPAWAHHSSRLGLQLELTSPTQAHRSDRHNTGVISLYHPTPHGLISLHTSLTPAHESPHQPRPGSWVSTLASHWLINLSRAPIWAYQPPRPACTRALVPEKDDTTYYCSIFAKPCLIYA